MLESRKQISALGPPLAQALLVLILFLGAGIPGLAQQGQPVQPAQGQPAQGDLTQPPAGAPNPASQNTPQPQQLPPDTVRPNYVLGPNDQVLIRAPEAEEIDNRPFRIDGDGNINLPLVGRIHAAGMSLQELEADLVKRLREYIREPQVFVTVVQFRSEPVFFVGLFVRPGIYTLQGNRTLLEMLTSVGGLQPNAERHVKVTRHEEYGPIPLPDAIVDPEKKVSTVDVNLGSLRENINPAENILLQPYDVISVGRAEPVYVNGEVGRVGGIELGERESIPILQALTQSGGFSRDAKKSKVRILRPILNTNRRAVIEVDVSELLDGKGLDIPLQPGDIVYVPRGYSRQFWQTFESVALPMLPYVIFAISQ
ncbi:MAG: polysaccharide biosynthesis/export family protein [Bryobacteraceae bacterium]|jgi:polysaccharide export outer membrane protein